MRIIKPAKMKYRIKEVAIYNQESNTWKPRFYVQEWVEQDRIFFFFKPIGDSWQYVYVVVEINNKINRIIPHFETKEAAILFLNDLSQGKSQTKYHAYD